MYVVLADQLLAGGGIDCLHCHQADKEIIRLYSLLLAAQVEDQ
jgi:hypothetical protein